MIKLFVCRICGDPYLGENKPSQCPFCGAPNKYIVLGEQYSEPVIENLSEISRKNLEAALNLEINASCLYLCMSNCSAKLEFKKLFKALSKVEREHAILISKALKKEIPVIELKEKICFGNDKANFEKTKSLEENAVKIYAKSASEAFEPRVKEIFEALTAVESEHIELSKEKLGRL